MERLDLNKDNYILYNKTEWNSKVFNGETNEIYEIHIDSFSNGVELLEKFESYCINNNVVYTSLRISPNAELLKNVLESSFYTAVENSLLVSTNLKCITENKLLNKFEFILRNATNSDLEKIKKIASENFNHGRFFEDAKISNDLAKKRNSNWVDDLKEKSNLLVGELNGDIFGFMAFKIKGKSCNLELGGVSSDYSYLAYSFWYKIFKKLQTENVMHLDALVSANNLGILNLYSFFNFKFKNSFVGYRKIRK